MSWESDDCDCAEDWTCMRHRGELLTMAKQGGTMTDEELSHTTMAELLEQNDRLRAENRRLVEACKLGLRVIEELVATDTGVALAMRAAIKGK